MVEDALSFWTEIQRYEDMLAADAKSLCFAPLSELYRKLGLLDDAISVAQKGCAAHPDYPLGYLALGNAYNDKGLSAEARQALEKVVALRPDHIQAMKLLGQLYVEQGETALARKVLGQVLQQDPDDLESTLLINSLGLTPIPAQPEELLEEVEIIEDLEEVIEEPPVETAASGVGAGAVPEPSGVRSTPVAPAPMPAVPEEPDDLWAIEDLEEVVAPEPAPKGEAAPSQRGATPDPLTTATLAELYVSQGFVGKAIAIYQELLLAHPSNRQYRLRCEELVGMQELQQQVAEPEQAKAAAAPIAPAPPVPAPTAAAPAAPEPPAAMEVPVAIEHISAAEAFAAMESPADFESAALEPVAVAETPVPQAGPAPQRGTEAELQRWLENIRRRRDGV